MPISIAQRKRFEAAIVRIQREATKTALATGANVQAIVTQHRQAISELILKSSTKTIERGNVISAASAGNLRRQIEAEFNTMLDSVKDAVVNGQKASLVEAGNAMSTIVSDLQVPGMLGFTIDANLVSIATNYSAGLISGIKGTSLEKIDGILSRAVLGSIDTVASVEQIAAVLGQAGVNPAGIMARATMIAKHEVNMIYSLALDNQIQQAMKMIGGMTKTWSFGTWREGRREDHQEMDGQTVPADEPFIFPNGEAGFFPRDPSLSAEQSIGCTCQVIYQIDPKAVFD
jgi:hypothetical protein